MKAVFLAVIVLISSTALWAQGAGDDPDCYQVINVVGRDCSGPHNCTSTTGCYGISFTAACTGTYQIDAWVACDGGADCSDCQSCVNVYAGLQNVGHVHTSNCSTGDCNEIGTVNLTGGVQYMVYACLLECGGGSCNSCSSNCKAYGCVRMGQASPCY